VARHGVEARYDTGCLIGGGGWGSGRGPPTTCACLRGGGARNRPDADCKVAIGHGRRRGRTRGRRPLLAHGKHWNTESKRSQPCTQKAEHCNVPPIKRHASVRAWRKFPWEAAQAHGAPQQPVKQKRAIASERLLSTPRRASCITAVDYEDSLRRGSSRPRRAGFKNNTFLK
jgi:hypothetical protein